MELVAIPFIGIKYVQLARIHNILKKLLKVGQMGVMTLTFPF
jgi:hypothetical protein